MSDLGITQEEADWGGAELMVGLDFPLGNNHVQSILRLKRSERAAEESGSQLLEAMNLNRTGARADGDDEPITSGLRRD